MADRELLKIGPGTTLRVLAHNESELLLEASYDGGGTMPPAHLHPHQDEHFEALAGTMQTRIDGHNGELRAGETVEIPAATVHLMWNAGPERAVLRWATRPSGRTLDWFRELAANLAGTPLADPATLLERYGDTFRLADA